MSFRGVYDNGNESCLSFVPRFGIWKILYMELAIESAD
jgi:hypothetical protein